MIAKTLGNDGGVEHRQAGAAETLRHQQPRDALLDQAIPELDIEPLAALGDLAELVHRQLLGEKAAQGLFEHLLLFT